VVGAPQDRNVVKPTKNEIRDSEFEKCGGIPLLHSGLYRGLGRGRESIKRCWEQGGVSWGCRERGSCDVGGTVSSTAGEEWIILLFGI